MDGSPSLKLNIVNDVPVARGQGEELCKTGLIDLEEDEPPGSRHATTASALADSTSIHSLHGSMGALAMRAVCETQDAKVMGLQCLLKLANESLRAIRPASLPCFGRRQSAREYFQRPAWECRMPTQHW